MTLRVPTPAIQGPQQLGGAQAQAADTPFQNLRLPDLAFNARLLSQIGGDAVRLGEYFQEQEDERLLLQLQAGLGEWERQTLYGEMPDGTGAPEGGVLALEGEAAFGLTERMQQDFDNFLSELNGPLSGLSANGRLAAQQYAQSRREALLDRVTRIEAEQRNRHIQQLRAQAAAAARAAATTEWYSDEAMAAAEARLISSVTNQAADAVAAGTAATQAGIAEGSIPPWARADLPSTGEEVQQDVARTVDNMVGQELDDFRRRAIETAVLEGNVVRAREIFDRSFADRLPALREGERVGTERQTTEWDRLLNIVTNAENDDVVMAVSGDLFSAYPNDRGAAFAELENRGYPGYAYEDIAAELERRYTRAERAAQQEQEQQLSRLFDLAANGELNTNDPAFLSQPDTVRQRLLDENAGLSASVDYTAVIELRGIQSRGDAALAAVNLEEDYLPRLDRQTYNYWADEILNARRRLEGDPNARPRDRAISTTIDNAISARMALDLDSSRNARTVTELYALFEERGRMAEAAEDVWDTRAINEYADFLMELVQVRESGRGRPVTTERYKAMLGLTDYDFEVPAGVPREYLPDIVDALQEQGTLFDEITPEMIRELYEEAQRAQ
jgi:hypothetical protein